MLWVDSSTSVKLTKVFGILCGNYEPKKWVYSEQTPWKWSQFLFIWSSSLIKLSILGQENTYWICEAHNGASSESKYMGRFHQQQNIAAENNLKSWRLLLAPDPTVMFSNGIDPDNPTETLWFLKKDILVIMCEIIWMKHLQISKLGDVIQLNDPEDL